MNYLLKLVFIIIIVMSFNGCSLNGSNGRFTNSSVQTIDMGKFTGLRIIQIASINYHDWKGQTQPKYVFTEIDKENFSDSLIRSFKRSDVRVLPSAQTKIRIEFTQFELAEGLQNQMLIIKADTEISRNGIITRKTIEISCKSKLTIGATKNYGVKMFIQELGNLLREQSSFKR
jgi:hypothetical protein